jgi:hypothetical protein
VLIYGILFVSEVLGKVKPGVGRREAEKVCCIDTVPLPLTWI